MILRILKSNHSVNYLLFPILGILFLFIDLFFPNPLVIDSQNSDPLIFRLIFKLIHNNLVVKTIIAWVIIIILALLIQQINTRYNFIRIRTAIPAPLSIIIFGGITTLHTLLPVYVAAIFLLFAIYRSFNAFDQTKPFSAAFDTGFLLGTGAIFYYNTIFIFPAFLVGFRILSREYGWRQLVLTIIGFLLPSTFVITYFYYTDQFSVLQENITVFFNQNNKRFNFSIPQMVLYGYLIILTVLSSIKIIQQFDSKKVSTRKYFMVFFLIFLLAITSYLLVPSVSSEILIIAGIPLTYVISNFFVFLRIRLFGEIAFSLLLLIVFVLQFL